jgi:hypothetical protein
MTMTKMLLALLLVPALSFGLESTPARKSLVKKPYRTYNGVAHSVPTTGGGQGSASGSGSTTFGSGGGVNGTAVTAGVFSGGQNFNPQGASHFATTAAGSVTDPQNGGTVAGAAGSPILTGKLPSVGGSGNLTASDSGSVSLGGSKNPVFGGAGNVTAAGSGSTALVTTAKNSASGGFNGGGLATVGSAALGTKVSAAGNAGGSVDGGSPSAGIVGGSGSGNAGGSVDVTTPFGGTTLGGSASGGGSGSGGAAGFPLTGDGTFSSAPMPK